MKNDRLTDRLDRFKQHITPADHDPAPAHIPTRCRRLADAVGGEVVTDRAGIYCRIATTYPIGFRFGNTVFEKPGPDASVAVSSYMALECAGEVPLANLLFVDTETTGLGGSGAVAFLVGCGSLRPDGFEVRQYLLPDYADEAALLEQVLAELKDEITLVSYNGAAFDLNLIRDRFIVNRVARDVPCAGHFDLLHSARRLFKRRLNDCTLASIEREVFAYYRQDDIPGHLIPSVYFDWLENDATEFLPAVLEHNRTDIVALYFLLLRVDEIFRSEGGVLDYADDLYSLSRVYGRRKHHQKVVANFETLRKSTGRPLDDEVLFFHSLAFKRQGQWREAVELWRQLVDLGGPAAFGAAVELSKHQEHQARDVQAALRYAVRAQQAGPPTRRLKEELHHRLSRLRRKSAGRGPK